RFDSNRSAVSLSSRIASACFATNMRSFSRPATFRLDDVPEAGHGDVDGPDAKDPALRPDRFEIQAGHDEVEIHVEARTVGRANEGAVRDHASREKAVAGSIEWFPPAPELKPHRLAHPPRREGVVGVEGEEEEEVAVFGSEQCGAGSPVVICPGE